MDKNQTIKNIEVGKFYLIHDGSRTGHPGLVVWKDDEKNTDDPGYLLLREMLPDGGAAASLGDGN